MVSETKLILKKLDTIKSDLDLLKAKLIDVDFVMTDLPWSNKRSRERF